MYDIGISQRKGKKTMDYKADFQEWFDQFEEDNKREPDLKECDGFWDGWRNRMCSYADELRDAAKYEVTL